MMLTSSSAERFAIGRDVISDIRVLRRVARATAVVSGAVSNVLATMISLQIVPIKELLDRLGVAAAFKTSVEGYLDIVD